LLRSLSHHFRSFSAPRIVTLVLARIVIAVSAPVCVVIIVIVLACAVLAVIVIVCHWGRSQMSLLIAAGAEARSCLPLGPNPEVVATMIVVTLIAPVIIAIRRWGRSQ